MGQRLGQQPTERQKQALMITGAVILLIAAGYAFDVTVWDLLELLIVPAAIALGVFWLEARQSQRDQESSDRERRRERQIDQRRRENELEVEFQRAQDAALQAYIDRIGQLVIDKDLRNERDGTDLRTIARAYTLTVLGGLDARRKRSVVRFLYEARLISTNERVIALGGADLTNANLEDMSLCARVLNSGDFTGETDLMARAEQMALYPFDIAHAAGSVNLMSVDLSGANLRGADLGGADLSNANLSGADLNGANLSHANLRGARGISEQQLEEQCKVLYGATMPDGTQHD